MADKNPKENKKDCLKSCDKKFIDCVESWRQDCLNRFGTCSSSCSI